MFKPQPFKKKGTVD